ncbi:MAG: hypothetical protein JW874_09080 [Spirochaetales bacterium]|nr:hypothetical protein [Spirochaetales bacterium]
MKKYIIAIFSVFLFFISGCKTAQHDINDFDTAHISGMVYCRGNDACANVRIVVNTAQSAEEKEDGKKKDKTEKTVYSDIYGRFSIPELEKGPHTVTASKQGFETNSFDFEFLNRTQSIYIYMISEEDLITELESENEAKNYNRASRTVDRLLALNPDSSRGLFLAAGVSMKLTEYEKALGYLDRLKGLEPDSIWPLVLSADIHEFHLKDPAQALAELQQIHQDKRDESVKEKIRKLEMLIKGMK